jgi:lipoprotein-anchoring transpeptidase ErfK/SrfK
VVGLFWAGFGASPRDEQNASFGALRPLPAPALEIGRPEALSSGRHLSRWTVVRHAAVAHARPFAASPAVAELAVRTTEGTPNLLTVLRSRAAADGKVWVEARLPVLPNGSVGWVRRDALGPYQVVDTRLVVDRGQLRATLFRAGRRVFTAPVGIGAAAWPTPAGEFAIRSELTRYAGRFYGPVAFGTTARSAVLTDWPGGGVVGIHGTSEPSLIPGRVSHGCIRMRNEDILRLSQLLPIGTPLTIR